MFFKGVVSRRPGEFPLHIVWAKWEVDFIGPITPPAKHLKAKQLKARYIITATEYLTR